PTRRYAVIGNGPGRIALEGLAERLGVSEKVEFHGQLAPAEAIEQARRGTLFAMPSTEEAFGVAYIEAMAAGVPAIGCRGEPGPEEIAAAGDGFMLVPPGDIERLTQRIDELVSDPHRLREAGQRARATFGGSLRHGGAAAGELPFPHRHVRPRALLALAGAGGHRALVCPTAGRLAPLAAWAGARRAGIPVILWASLWAHPRTPAHALTYL